MSTPTIARTTTFHFNASNGVHVDLHFVHQNIYTNLEVNFRHDGEQRDAYVNYVGSHMDRCGVVMPINEYERFKLARRLIDALDETFIALRAENNVFTGKNPDRLGTLEDIPMMEKCINKIKEQIDRKPIVRESNGGFLRRFLKAIGRDSMHSSI